MTTKYFLVGGGNPFASFNIIGKSNDGLTWTTFNQGYTGPIRAFAWSQELRLWVAVADNSHVFTSSNGETWTHQTVGSSAWQGVAWSSSLGLFVIVGSSGGLYTSPDGATWTSRTSGFGTDGIMDVDWSPSLGLFVAVGANGKYSRSSNGTSWTNSTMGTGGPFLRDVTWASGLGVFVAGGDREPGSDPPKLYTSPDGSTWTSRTPNIGDQFENLHSGAWADSLGLLVTGSSHWHSTSTSATSWTMRDNNPAVDVAWSEDLGRFVSVPGTATPRTSSDGITWTTAGQSFSWTDQLFAAAWGGSAKRGILVGSVAV